MAIDRGVLVIELDVTGTEIGMVGVAMEADHAVSGWFHSVDPVVLVLHAVGIPEPDFQSRPIDFVGVAQKRGRIDIGHDVPGPPS